MKSIKQGRGPSLIEGIALLGMSVVMIIMGGEFRSREPDFGVFGRNQGMDIGTTMCYVFALVCVIAGIYNIYCAVAKNRPSQIDITSGNEEPDPLNEHFHGRYDVESTKSPAAKDGMYCPYCGKPIQADFAFCSHCGKELKK